MKDPEVPDPFLLSSKHNQCFLFMVIYFIISSLLFIVFHCMHIHSLKTRSFINSKPFKKKTIQLKNFLSTFFTLLSATSMFNSFSNAYHYHFVIISLLRVFFLQLICFSILSLEEASSFLTQLGPQFFNATSMFYSYSAK